MKFDLVIYLTNRCNLFCDHCDQSSGNPRENELTTSEILEGVQKLLRSEPFEHLQFELAANATEIKQVCLSGGEPVLHKDFFSISKTLIKMGLEVNFITNATFSPVYYPRILELPFKGIYVSLDGLETTHNLLRRSGLSFKRVMQFLEFLQPYLKNNLRELLNLESKLAFAADLYIVTCVTSKSVSELDAMAELLAQYQIKHWFLKPIEMKGRAIAHAELCLDQLGERKLVEFMGNIEIPLTRKLIFC